MQITTKKLPPLPTYFPNLCTYKYSVDRKGMKTICRDGNAAG